MLEAIEVDSQLAKLEWRFARDALGGDPGTGALVRGVDHFRLNS